MSSSSNQYRLRTIAVLAAASAAVAAILTEAELAHARRRGKRRRQEPQYTEIDLNPFPPRQGEPMPEPDKATVEKAFTAPSAQYKAPPEQGAENAVNTVSVIEPSGMPVFEPAEKEVTDEEPASGNFVVQGNAEAENCENAASSSMPGATPAAEPAAREDTAVPAAQDRPAEKPGETAPAVAARTGKAFRGDAFNGCGQVILVTAPDMDAGSGTLRTFEKESGAWAQAICTEAALGARGMVYDAEKAEGDLKTPAGIYPLCYAFGWAENPGTRMEYKKADDSSWFDENPDSPDYNRWVSEYPGGNCEQMNIEPYKYGVNICYNESRTPGRGSGIFLHVRSRGGGTAGCVAIGEEELVSLLKWLDPAKKPRILICPESDLAEYYF